MANRYDIIHIDFQANARGANAAIESIRKEAEESSKKIEQLKKDLDAATKGGDTYTADLIKGNLRGEEKRLRQLTQAQNELIKGMRVLDQAVKQFNDGSLQEMNAAFQKSAYNAAKLAQSKMQTGTKEWREMGAVMQETEQNYTRMQRDTDQLIEHLKNGGTVFRKTLEDEKKGLQDLLQVLPYMGVEYRKAEEQLKFLTKTTDDMLIKERQLKGEIVTTDDARRESLKLTQDGAEAARRQGELAEKEIEQRTKVAEVLDKQRIAQEQMAKQSAQEVADNIERLQEYEDVIEGAGIAIKEVQDKIKGKQDKADRLEGDADIAYRQYLDLQKKRDEATKNDTQATKENTEATEKNVKANKKQTDETKETTAAEDKATESKKKKTKATKDDTKATKENTEASKEEAEQVDEVAEAKKRWDTADKKARRARNEANKAIEEGNNTIKENNALIDDTKNKQAQLEKQHEKTVATNKRNQEMLAKTTEMQQQNGEAMQQAELKKIQAQGLTMKQLETIISLYKKQHDEELEANTDAWREKGAEIERLTKILNEWKGAPVLQMMTDRMQDVGSLSKSALEETRKFWEAMAQGADKGSEKLATAEAHIKALVEEEQKRNLTAMKASSDRLSGNLGLMSQGDIRQAIEDAKKYQLTLGSTSEEAKKLAQAIVNAEEHLKRYGVEAERAARKQEEADKKVQRAERDKQEQEAQAQQQQLRMMRERIVFEKQRQSLSADALTETKKYWEAVARGANEGSWAQKNALTMMERITTEEERRAKKKNVEKADRLIGTRYLTLSESELRESIEAARELQKELAPTDDLYKRLSAQIVKAEEHIKSYGVEAQRAAVRQAESISQMQQQLQQGTALSESALKAQQSFWQRLIDDPKTASESLDEYRNNLQRSIDLQKDVAETTRRMAGEIVTVNDAMKLSNNLTKENAEERLRLANIEKEEATDARTILEGSRDGAKQRMEAAEQELAIVDKELEKQRELSGALREAERLRAELPKAQDEYTDALHQSIKEKGEWIKLNDEVIKATIKVEELKEKLANTSNPKEQLKIREELKKAEDDLTNAQAKADEQSEKLTKTREKQYAVEEKINKITEESKKVLGGRDYDTERDKLDNLEREHAQLSQTLTEEKNNYEGLSQAVSAAQEREKNAAIELAQAEKASQQSIEEAIAVLEKQQKITTDESEYNKQAEALDKLKQKLKETTGEWMSFADAEKLAQQAALSANGEGNFIATAQQMQQAQQAVQREYDKTVKSIQKLEQAQTKDQAAIDKEKSKLETLEKELKDLKFEQDNFNMSHEKMQRLINEPVRADNLDELKAAIKRADGELHRMKQSLGQNNAQYKAFAEQVRNAKNQLKEMEGQAKASATAWEKAWSRLKTYVVMYMGFNAAWNKMTSMAGDLMELSDKMGEVRKTTQLSAEAVAELSKNLAKLDVRTPLEELMAISASAGQLGLKSVEDIQGFTEAANMLMVALPEMGKEAATEMMRVAIATGEVNKIRKQLEEGTVEGSNATAVAMTKIASTIDRLRASSASTAPEITDFVKRLGAVAAQSGISIDQVAALGSTISSLGMRVEMSATALSRMIPAIKNNAFAIANAIGVAPEALRSLFEAGRGMEAILMIFQHLKEQNANADTIESLLGIGNMKDVMKQLNQQGARAGIVFAGLSQNVDELRKQLVIAGDAYERNTAIQDEFNRMNDTTAAKWERLKNTIEEMVVSDWTQRVLGGLIEGVHKIINLLVGNSGLSAALLTIITLFGVLKLNIMGIMWSALATALVKIVDLFKNWRIALDLLIVRMKAMTAAQWTNVFLAIAAAVAVLIYKLQQLSERASIVANEMAKANEEIMKQTGAVDKLFRSVAKTNAELENAKKRLEEVARAGNDTTESENALKKASSDHAAAIRDINSKYGQYLGYMLSETSSAEQLARARELINAKLRETITLKQQEAALGSVEQEYGGRVNKKASSMERTLEHFYGDDYDRAARVSVAISEAAQKYAKNSEEYQKAVKKILADNKIQADVAESYMGTFEDYRSAIEEYTKQEDAVTRRFEARTNVARKESREAVNKDLNAILADWKDLVDQYRKAEGKEKEKLAAEVYKQQRAYANAVANNAEYFDGDKRKEVYDRNIKNMKTYEKGLRSVAGETIRTIDAMERADSKITGLDLSNDGESGNNPWGGGHDAASTDWKNMTANQLVERRKQMKDFVNAIQTDTDVQSVLKEDAALKKAIENGMSADMRTVIEWYNTERLKIQDELHARHLTNTGDWMDPKKQRGAHKQFRDEMDAYLHELDAYYTERKTRIEEAGTDEGLTEAEIKNRTLNNEMEWQQRRAELQKLYSRKQKEVTEEELNAIYHIIAERTGDSEKFVKAQITKTNQFVDSIEKSGENGAAIVHRWMSQVELDTERSYLKGQQALTKQMRAIEAIIDKERPFNGITKSLQESLATMDILTGEMRKEYNELMKQGADMAKFNERQNREEMKRTAFLLGEAENAYSTTIDHVMDDMRQKGMTAWADWLSADPKLQEALMAQLRSTYDAIQDAIKKEASQLKKQAEIMWNNILMPDGKTTLKQQTDRIVAQLGLDEGRVSRANSLIGAGQASERVADKLAIQQMKVQLAMQEHYYNLMKKQGQAHVDMLNAQAKAAKERGDEEEATRKTLDAQHAQMSLNLATSKEETELAKQREDIIARTEESQNRLYTELKSWADLLASSLQGVFEASHAGDAEYYNELAKLNLTGKGGPGAGTYIVIDNEGTEDATAHYEYLDERQALERQHEIERENAQAEAWKKVMDDLNMKMSDMITDQLNAMMQNASVDMNTDATRLNTDALGTLTERLAQGIEVKNGGGTSGTGKTDGTGNNDVTGSDVSDFVNGKQNLAGGVTPETLPSGGTDAVSDFATGRMMYYQQVSAAAQQAAQAEIDASNQVRDTIISNTQQQTQSTLQSNKKMTAGTQSMFAKMTSAANLYGIAYQAMSNENLSTSQKMQLIAVQAAGQAAISSLTATLAETTAETTTRTPSVFAWLWSKLGPAAIPVFAIFTGGLGALMGLATAKITKSKSQIAQATGASVGAGRLATGMLTYASGNINELSDPTSLTVGRSYNVDGADGKTYRAKYTGKDTKTHITNGPEFHLVGEKGQEAIIDAHTTQLIRMNDTGIWRDIQTLYNGGSLSTVTRRRRGKGVRAFADGNLDDFEEVDNGSGFTVQDSGFNPEMLAGFQSSLDRNNELLERALTQGIKGVFNVYGKGGLVDSYDTGKKTVNRHGERY